MEQVIFYPPYASAKRHNPDNRFMHEKKIKKIIGDFFDTTYEDVTIKSRKREIVYVRQMMMYFLAKYTQLTLVTIGKMFGGKDHTTVMHSLQVIDDLKDVYPQIANQIERITEKLLLCESE